MAVPLEEPEDPEPEPADPELEEPDEAELAAAGSAFVSFFVSLAPSPEGSLAPSPDERLAAEPDRLSVL